MGEKIYARWKGVEKVKKLTRRDAFKTETGIATEVWIGANRCPEIRL